MEKKGVMRGSYTIEAAVLLSMITFVLAALILTAFYLHDRSVCQSTACEAPRQEIIFSGKKTAVQLLQK